MVLDELDGADVVAMVQLCVLHQESSAGEQLGGLLGVLIPGADTLDGAVFAQHIFGVENDLAVVLSRGQAGAYIVSDVQDGLQLSHPLRLHMRGVQLDGIAQQLGDLVGTESFGYYVPK